MKCAGACAKYNAAGCRHSFGFVFVLLMKVKWYYIFKLLNSN
ncbi:hypothetical protein POKO110462_22605 [Pontibacter korlensis]